MNTPTGMSFDDASMLRVVIYERNEIGKVDDYVEGRERTVTTSNDMEDKEKTSANH